MAKSKPTEDTTPAEATPSAAHDITIAGIVLSVPAPFGEGHVLSSVEAGVLNQTYFENIRNNFASAVKKVKEAAETAGTEIDPGALQTALDEYVAGYTFGVRRGGGGSRVAMDPIDKETKRIAETKVKAALAKKGIKFKDVDKANFNKIVAEVIEKHPQIRVAAETIVEARKAAGEDTLELDI